MDTPTRYISDRELAKRYDTSRSTVWRWTARGILPQPVQISEGCTRWLAHEIEQRDAARLDNRRGQTGT